MSDKLFVAASATEVATFSPQFGPLNSLSSLPDGFDIKDVKVDPSSHYIGICGAKEARIYAADLSNYFTLQTQGKDLVGIIFHNDQKAIVVATVDGFVMFFRETEGAQAV